MLIRIGTRARDINQSFLRFVGLEGIQNAIEWQRGLYLSIRMLTTNPTRYPLIREARRFSFDVRQFVYKRTAHSVAYRVMYRVEYNAELGSMVVIVHLRHSANRVITRKQAREIEAQDEQIK